MKALWECQICGEEYKGGEGLSIHVSRYHNVSSKQYFDSYLGVEKMCISCGKPSSFQSIVKGYYDHCSVDCANRCVIKRARASKSKMGHGCSLETRMKFSEIRKRSKASPETRAKMSKARKGKHFPEVAKKMSERMQIQYELTGKPTTSPFGFTTCGVAELRFIKELQKFSNFKIIPQYAIAGRYIDGFIEALNLAIEFDETGNHSCAFLQERDRARELQILNENPEIKFFRVKEKDWDKNQQGVVDRFIEVQTSKMMR